MKKVKFICLFILILFLFLINQMPLIKAPFTDNGSLSQIAYDCGIINTTNGNYRMNQSVTASGTCFTINAQNITLDCNGNTITYSTGGLGSTYGITSAKYNTTIKNCNILDGNWSLNAAITRYGIYFNTSTSNHSTVYNNTINTSNSYGIYLLTNANFNNLTGNNATSNSGSGIYLTASSNNTLTNNNGTSNSGYGIYFATSQWNNLMNNIGTTNSTTTNYGGIVLASGNNTLTNNLGISTANTSGILLFTNSNNNTLTNNNGTSNAGVGIYLYQNSNTTLANNTGASNSNYGISLLTSSNNILTNNNATSNSSSGIYLTASSNNNLTGNNGTSNLGSGVYIYQGSNNTLVNNIGASNVSHGIYLLASSNNTLTNNNGTSNSGSGIYLVTSQWSNLTNNIGTTNSTTTNYGGIVFFTSGNNTLTNNLGISTANTSGILLFTNSNNNNLTGNNGTSNSGYGIYLYSVSNNLLRNNNATSNSSYGIYSDGVLNNNTFVDNTFTNVNWSNYLYFSLNANLSLSLTSATLNSYCVPSYNTDSVNFSYERSDESSWQTSEINKTNDIYEVGDSITAKGLWQASLDSHMGSNSAFHNFGVSSTICAYSYQRYLENVTTKSNATVVVFCGTNDANQNVLLSNTTYYLELMYNLSVQRGQRIVFVNAGTCGADRDAINSWLLSFTQSKGVTLVDYHAFLNDLSSGCVANLTLTDDGTHPNTYGYGLLGKLIWEQAFNSATNLSARFESSKPLIHYDQGKTYNIKCMSDSDSNLFQTSYVLPSSFTSGGGVFNNASNINTTLANVSAKIAGSDYNSSSVYYDSTDINITSNTSALEFNYNFSKYDFNFTSVSVDNETVGDKAFLSVWGIYRRRNCRNEKYDNLQRKSSIQFSLRQGRRECYKYFSCM